MNSEIEKLKLIEWIIKLKDDSVVEKLKMLKEHQKQTDWWDEITEEEKASIEKGLGDIKAGKVIPHNKVKKEYEKWL